MAAIDLEKLLQPVSPDAPCGEDLEYDPAFAEMTRAAEGKAEQQMGDAIVEAEEPDWREVRSKALELLDRTKDLRIGVLLTRALLDTDGMMGMSKGLDLIKGMLENWWDSVHPQLDPEDDNDPTMRVNTMLSLCSQETFLRELREAPLVSSQALGRFGMREIEIAAGKLPAPAGVEPPDMTRIDAAFMDCDLDWLKETAEAVAAAASTAQAIETYMTEKVGVEQALDLSELPAMLSSAHQILAERLAKRGADTASPLPGGIAAPEAAAQPSAGEIRSREDVIRMLDKACEFFSKHEPSSPVPLLLRRAKRLIAKDFMEILRDMAPEAVAQAEKIGGPQGGSG